jgi:hypothetical protein
MTEKEERVAAKELSERLGFRLVDDDDWMLNENGERVAAHGTYWFLLSGHDDERLDEPVRYGQWPEKTETIIKRLWHCCVQFSAEHSRFDAAQKANRQKLSIALIVVIASSLAVPLLLGALHLIGIQQFNRLWSFCTHLAAAGVGSLVIGRLWRLK